MRSNIDRTTATLSSAAGSGVALRLTRAIVGPAPGQWWLGLGPAIGRSRAPVQRQPPSAQLTVWSNSCQPAGATIRQSDGPAKPIRQPGALVPSVSDPPWGTAKIAQRVVDVANRASRSAVLGGVP
jgi:hypothetical protein